MRLASALTAPATVPPDAHHGRVLPGNPFSGSFEGDGLLWQDLFGTQLSLSREQAMTIPGVARGRGILLSLICDKPLVDYSRAANAAAATKSATQPTWLYHTSGWQDPWQRMALTIDDHIFHGCSLWGVQRGAQPARGLRPIVDAWHIDFDAWEVDPAGRICVADEDGQMVPADESEVLYLPSAHDGLLNYAARTFRAAVDMERSWAARAKNPLPAIDLHETEETNMDDDERQDVVDAWAAARMDPNGAIASTPHNIDARVLGTIDPNLYIEGRNAVRLDLANFFQIPGSLMDATTAEASLTYVTQDSQASSLDSMTLPYWIRPIEGRLGQDDVVAQGHVVRFSFAEAYTEPQGRIDTQQQQQPAAAAAAPTTQEGETAQ